MVYLSVVIAWKYRLLLSEQEYIGCAMGGDIHASSSFPVPRIGDEEFPVVHFAVYLFLRVQFLEEVLLEEKWIQIYWN